MGELVRGMLLPHAVSHPVVPRLRALGAEVARLGPDAIVLASADWLTTFRHYVGGPVRLRGGPGQNETADLAAAAPYDYPGDPELARALVAAGMAARITAALTDESTLPLGDGIVSLRYLTPDGDVPVVPISLCSLADLGETLRWGRAIGAAVRVERKRVLFIVAGAEDGGRHLALLLGALGSGYRDRILSCGPAPIRERALLTLSPD